MALTRRQKQVLDFLAQFISERGYSPSFEEIAQAMGLSSVATVHKHIQSLDRKGFIRRGQNRSRSIDVVALPGPAPFRKPARGARRPIEARRVFPLLGRIAAGQPVEAFPASENFSLDDFASSKGEIFVLKVKGDSMVDDHICDGDYILVERTSEARSGEIVVALIEGAEATLKRFFPEREGMVRLQPANAQMDAIVLPGRNVRVQGRVIGVLRKY